MKSHEACKLYDWADYMEANIGAPGNKADLRWQKREVDKLRRLAAKVERALVAKVRRRK